MCVISLFIKRLSRPPDFLSLPRPSCLSSTPSSSSSPSPASPPTPSWPISPPGALPDYCLLLILPRNLLFRNLTFHIMAPVVLDSPVMNMHNPALSSISRLQFNGHIHTPPSSDHSRNDEASPLASTAPLPPVQARNTSSPFPLDPALRERNGENVDPANGQNGPSANSELACTNCGTVTTPQWRRGDDGKSICNACGEYCLL